MTRWRTRPLGRSDRQRKALFDLKRGLERAIGGGVNTRTVAGFDFGAARKLLDQAQAADAQAHGAACEANAVAAQCGKPTVVWREA